MTRWRLIFLCTLVLVAAGVVALWQSGPQEPVYQGKKLFEWINEAGSDPTYAQTEQARIAINAIGTNAIPYLLSEFAARQSRLATLWSEWASRKTGLDFGFDEGYPRRGRALMGFNFLGTNATAAVPALLTYLDDDECRIHAALAIRGCGEMALPYLLKASASTNVLIHRGVIMVLGLLAQRTEAAIPPLIALTQHTNEGTRGLAAFGLRDVRLQADLVIPALVRTLADTNVYVQQMAAFSLSQMGKRAKEAVPDLLLMMQDTNLTRVSWASNALFQIDPTALPRAAAP